MGTVLLRRYSERDHRAVLILTVLCDRRGCDRVDATAVPTDGQQEIANPPNQLPPDHQAALVLLHRRGWQTGKLVRCPDHVTPTWAATRPQRPAHALGDGAAEPRPAP